MVTAATTVETSAALVVADDAGVRIGALYDQYGHLAYTLALRMLRDRMAAEEVVQDAFVGAWRGAGSFDASRGSMKTWLLAAVHHRCVDRLRGARRAQHDVPLDLLHEMDGGGDTFDTVAERLRAAAVRRALAALPAEQRLAIELAYFEGLTHAELAERLQVPLGTLKGRLRLGLQKLRALGLQQDARA